MILPGITLALGITAPQADCQRRTVLPLSSRTCRDRPSPNEAACANEGRLEFRERHFPRQDQRYTRQVTGRLEQTPQTCPLRHQALTRRGSRTPRLAGPASGLRAGCPHRSPGEDRPAASPRRVVRGSPQDGHTDTHRTTPPPPQAAVPLATRSPALTTASPARFLGRPGSRSVSSSPLGLQREPGALLWRERRGGGRRRLLRAGKGGKGGKAAPQPPAPQNPAEVRPGAILLSFLWKKTRKSRTGPPGRACPKEEGAAHGQGQTRQV